MVSNTLFNKSNNDEEILENIIIEIATFPFDVYLYYTDINGNFTRSSFSHSDSVTLDKIKLPFYANLEPQYSSTVFRLTASNFSSGYGQIGGSYTFNPDLSGNWGSTNILIIFNNNKFNFNV